VNYDGLVEGKTDFIDRKNELRMVERVCRFFEKYQSPIADDTVIYKPTAQRRSLFNFN